MPGIQQKQDIDARKSLVYLQNQSQTIDSIEFATPASSIFAFELYSNVRFAPGII